MFPLRNHGNRIRLLIELTPCDVRSWASRD